VLAAEHLLDLARLHFLVERLDGLRKLGVYGLARRGPLEEDPEVVGPLPQGRSQFAILFQAAATLQYTLRFGLVLPEVWRGGARLETIQFVGWVSGFKDSSTDRQHVC
jgi:hypothetical protein